MADRAGGKAKKQQAAAGAAADAGRRRNATGPARPPTGPTGEQVEISDKINLVSAAQLV
jgi:hypothetical protein